ncbi:hypothetical protein Ancab_015028 [Ancistrocladus abbreviatus]
MPTIILSPTPTVQYPNKMHYPNSKQYKPQPTRNTSRSAMNFTKMGNHISMSCFNSRGGSDAQTTACSISYPLPGQHITIQTFRELNPHLTSRLTSTRTGTPSNGWDPSSFRVPDDLEQWVGEHFNKIFINADDQEGNNPAARPSENNRYVLKPDVDRPQSLIIEGPSRVGKTAWARSLGKHNYLSGHLDFNSPRFFK